MDFHIPPVSAAPDLIAANLRADISEQACKCGQCREGVDTALCIASQLACDGTDALNRSLYPGSSVVINFATASNEIHEEKGCR